MKHYARQPCGGKGFFGLCTPVTVHGSHFHREAKARVQGRSQEAGPEAETMKNTGYCLVPCGSLSLLFYTPRVSFLGVALPRVLWALPHQSLRKMHYRLTHRPVCEGIFANYFPLPGWLYLCQVDKKPNQDKGWFSKPLVVFLQWAGLPGVTSHEW